LMFRDVKDSDEGVIIVLGMLVGLGVHVPALILVLGWGQ
jgi:hypothetical protein